MRRGSLFGKPCVLIKDGEYEVIAEAIVLNRENKTRKGKINSADGGGINPKIESRYAQIKREEDDEIEKDDPSVGFLD